MLESTSKMQVELILDRFEVLSLTIFYKLPRSFIIYFFSVMSIL